MNETIDTFELMAPHLISAVRPEDMRIIVKEDNISVQEALIERVKVSLGSILQAAVDEKKINSYRMEFVWVPGGQSRGYLDDVDAVLTEYTRNEKNIFVPVFKGADGQRGLASFLWDSHYRGIIGLSDSGYRDQINQSKVSCITTVVREK